MIGMLLLLKEFSKLKFNSTVDVIFLLGIDPSKGEQSVKGSCVLSALEPERQ